MTRFDFKQFSVDDSGCGMKICSDSVLLGAWFFEPYASARSVADIGAGSGVLALIAAQCCPQAAVTAIEIDAGAAEASRLNFEASPWTARLTLVEGDFSLWTPSSPLDLIISNPPYFTNGAIAADAARAAARHQQGLSYASLLRKGAQCLVTDGHLGLVSPAEFEQEIIFEAEMASLKLRRLLRVQTSPRKPVTRLLFDFGKADGTASVETLALREPDGSISASYRSLVDSFYIKLK